MIMKGDGMVWYTKLIEHLELNSPEGNRPDGRIQEGDVQFYLDATLWRIARQVERVDGHIGQVAESSQCGIGIEHEVLQVAVSHCRRCIRIERAIERDVHLRFFNEVIHEYHKVLAFFVQLQSYGIIELQHILVSIMYPDAFGHEKLA